MYFKPFIEKPQTLLFLCFIITLLTACQNKEGKKAPVSLTPSPTADDQRNEMEDENSSAKLIGDVVFVHGIRGDSYNLDFDTGAVSYTHLTLPTN